MPSTMDTDITQQSREISFVEATVEALAEEMRRDSRIFYMGEGIGPRGGNFKQTKGLYEEFGPQRVRDTPISELGFTGVGVGAAMAGMHPVVDLMFADFLTEAMDQIVHQSGKIHYLSGGRVDVPLVVRVAHGEVRSAGAHHSGSTYAWFVHATGLKVVVPSTPADAKGIWKTALRERCPVLIFEHKALYTMKGHVPGGEYLVPFGQATVVRAGRDVTVVAVGSMVHKALAAAGTLEGEGIATEIIDPRTLVPLDKETILDSVKKTGRLVVADDGFEPCGFGAEVAAIVAAEGLDWLDAPVARVSMPAVPQPFSPPLEQALVPSAEKVATAVHSVLGR